MTISVPAHREVAVLQERVFHYAKRYKQIEGENGEQINLEIKRIQNMSVAPLVEFQQLIDATIAKLARITSPISIFYGELDELLYKESANLVYRSVISSQNRLKVILIPST
ncbi:hypothetical protein [Halobacillus naozhouensis]|uniref:Uncharacterized protein n=1 Tax=Halobacillus naozhouensis TaxID=554880 RepID=A0ABY8J3T5_9BACI|nr:hypothetical protein [Halobacillus naozhouensis]WFT76264.1 hypothetical protein P9989_07840 [Halobacillus naozhouensis]